MSKKLQPAQQVLKENNILSRVMQQVNRLQALNDAVKRLLPRDLGAHIQVANLDKGRLILEVDSNSWASILHYQKSDLLQQLRGNPEFAGLISIEHRVNPALKFAPKSVRSLRPPVKLSINNLKMLTELAANTKDTKLRDSLLQLIEHQNKK
jgi:hypothetical protein